MYSNLKQTVLNIAGPLVEAEQLAIWGLDIVGGPRTTVRLFIDLPLRELPDQAREDPSGAFSATIDQCEHISRQLGLALEVEDNIQGPWVLEVSSPGLERRFFSLDQMRAYRGDIVECVLHSALPEHAGRKTFRGRLADVGEDAFVIEPCAISGEGEVLPENIPPARIPWSSVRMARRIHIFAQPRKPGKGPKDKAARQK